MKHLIICLLAAITFTSCDVATFSESYVTPYTYTTVVTTPRVVTVVRPRYVHVTPPPPPPRVIARRNPIIVVKPAQPKPMPRRR